MTPTSSSPARRGALFRAPRVRSVHASHGLARRAQPALLAVRPSLLSVGQRPNATLCPKKDRAFAQKKTSAPRTRTVRRTSHFPSAACALFGCSLCALVQSFHNQLLCFHALPHSLKKAPGIGVPPKKKSLALNELRTLPNANARKSEYRKSKLIACRRLESDAQPRMRDSRLCVIVSGRPPVSARRVSRILKTQSEVHSL